MPAGTVDVTRLVIGIVGGTGPQGRGLAARLAAVGQQVLIGSRDASRAATVADQLISSGSNVHVRGLDNHSVAATADVVVIAVPWEGHRAMVTSLAAQLDGKIVVDCVNPLGFDKQGPYAVDVPEGSAAQQAQSLLPNSHVVGAFHHLSATLLSDLSVALETDVLVVGDYRPATDVVQQLTDRVPGLRGIYAGRLRNCRQVEALTANLIAVNRRYRAHSGIRVTDV